MKSWKRIEPTEVHKVGHRTIVTKTFILPDGTKADFQTYDSEQREYVAVIALTSDKQVIVARQFRAGPEMVMDELPGGGVDPGENLETAAKRELLEETCYKAEKLEYLGAVAKDVLFNAKHHYFLAENCKMVQQAQELDDSEFIEIVLMDMKEFLASVQAGNNSEIPGVFLAYDKLMMLANKH